MFHGVSLANGFVIGCTVALTAGTVRADIMGFDGLNPSVWKYNQSDTGTPADLPAPDTIHITNLGGGEARSIFHKTPQSISEFTATFTYQALDAIGNQHYDRGITFAIHNDPRGPLALGERSNDLGYDGNSVTRIKPSAAVTFRLDSLSGFFTGGEIGGGAHSVSPVDLRSGHPIDVTLVYDGFYLFGSLVDSVTSATYPITDTIVGDLASVVGGPTAYVGFTASTNFGVDQYISDFRFTSAVVPEPATLSLLVIAGALLLRGRRGQSG